MDLRPSTVLLPAANADCSDLHTTLARLLRQCCGIESAAALHTALEGIEGVEGVEGVEGIAAIAGAAGAASALATTLLRGLPQLFEGLDASLRHAEHQADLEAERRQHARTAELSTANARLAADLARRERVMQALRAAAAALAAHGDLLPRVPVDDDLDGWSALIPELVELQARRRTDLANHRFAMDQHAIVSVTDIDGRIVHVNDRFCAINGYTRAELLGQPQSIINSALHPRSYFDSMWATVRNGAVWHGEICHLTKHALPYWVDATVVPFLDGAGKPYQFITIRTDISTSKRLAQKIAVSERQYREVVNSLSEVVFQVDASGRWHFLNPAWTAITGFEVAASLGQPFSDYLDPDARAAALAGFAGIVAGNGDSGRQLMRFLTRDGQRRYLEAHARAEFDDAGVCSGVTGSLTDVTEQKAVAQALQTARDAAESASRAKSEFLANMSHEIRTPINSIMGMTELVLESTLTAQQRSYLDIVHGSADALLAMIDDILDFSRIEGGAIELAAVPFDLAQLVRESLQAQAARAADHCIALLLDIDAALPPCVLGDPARLRQILVNLIGNAVKFTDAGQVQVRVRALGAAADGVERVSITVCDTGIGIAPEQQASIFDAFRQADGSASRRFGGAGLGLSLTRRLAGLMGGSISVDSEVGRGSSFCLELALPVAVGAGAARVAADASLAGRTVLLIEASASSAALLRELVEGGGDVIEQRCGPDALAWCAANSDATVDFIVIDDDLPLMDGFDTALALASSALRQVPVLMLSAAAAGDAQRQQRLGIGACLPAPPQRAPLRAALQQLLGQRRPPLATVDASAPTRCLRVLLVEDNELNQQLAHILLNKWGHDVSIASNGIEALAIHAQAHFDVILMDLQMPEMGGLEATAHIRRREQGGSAASIIIAMTANAFEGDREKCIAGGMDDYLSKPFRAHEFQQMMARYAVK
ncbi:response regulator [Massilia sp. PWRC2]|uniref:response regulator n=1 Tax=Massilia sp. PWRC2 TaxID=2804626 RepID=UPI003CEDAE4C